MTRYQRRKGADSERSLVRWFNQNGYPDARRSFAGDGRQAGDIDGMSCVIEVKAHATARIESWLRDLEKVRGDYPGFLIWHTPGVGNPAYWSVYWRNGLGETQSCRVIDIWGKATDAAI